MSQLKKLKQMVTTKEEEEEHVMHPKEAEDDDIEDSDSDFDPIGFGIEERIRQVQSWFFFLLMIYLMQGRRNLKNLGGDKGLFHLYLSELAL